MAANSLGVQHPAYAVALQNLGLYYDVIENDTAKADEFFAQARAAVKGKPLPLAYGFYWLAIFHKNVMHDEGRAAILLAQAADIQREDIPDG